MLSEKRSRSLFRISSVARISRGNPTLFAIALFSSAISTAFQISDSALSSNKNSVYVVSGCSRGIGLEFTTQLLQRSEASIVGLTRRSNVAALQKLQSSFPERLHLVEVDLEDQKSVDLAGAAVAQITDHVDLLINTAGILGDGKTTPGPERSILSIERDWFEKTLNANLVGHVMMTKSLVPLLKRKVDSSSKQQGIVEPVVPSKIVNLSARVGSIGDNNLGGWYSYRISKAGLNMFTKTCCVELKRFGCMAISIHPGTTDTDLSTPFQKNVTPGKLFPVAYSVDQMLQVIWKSNLKDNGKFFAYDGTEIEW